MAQLHIAMEPTRWLESKKTRKKAPIICGKGGLFFVFLDPRPHQISNWDLTSCNYFICMKNIALERLQNIHKSGNICLFLEFEVSIEITLQDYLGF